MFPSSVGPGVCQPAPGTGKEAPGRRGMTRQDVARDSMS